MAAAPAENSLDGDASRALPDEGRGLGDEPAQTTMANAVAPGPTSVRHIVIPSVDVMSAAASRAGNRRGKRSKVYQEAMAEARAKRSVSEVEQPPTRAEVLAKARAAKAARKEASAPSGPSEESATSLVPIKVNL